MTFLSKILPFRINLKENLVPKNTIVIVRHDTQVTKELINELVVPMAKDKTRSWFPDNAYRCLPLTIANQYGFFIKSEFTFGVEWNNDTSNNGLHFFFPEEPLETIDATAVTRITSWFGNGIFTFNYPISFRTPPGINLMIMPAPNCMLPLITPLTAVVETDNLNSHFTFNFRIQIPNTRIVIPKGTVLASVMPIPRYFVDRFVMKYEDEVFSEEVAFAERSIVEEFNKARAHVQNTPIKGLKNETIKFDRTYANGTDIFGNKYPDHQITVNYGGDPSSNGD